MFYCTATVLRNNNYDSFKFRHCLEDNNDLIHHRSSCLLHQNVAYRWKIGNSIAELSIFYEITLFKPFPISAETGSLLTLLKEWSHTEHYANIIIDPRWMKCPYDVADMSHFNVADTSHFITVAKLF